MHKLIFILFLFIPSLFFAADKTNEWEEMPHSITELIEDGYSIIDKFTIGPYRFYTLEGKFHAIFMCRVSATSNKPKTQCYKERSY